MFHFLIVTLCMSFMFSFLDRHSLRVIHVSFLDRHSLRVIHVAVDYHLSQQAIVQSW